MFRNFIANLSKNQKIFGIIILEIIFMITIISIVKVCTEPKTSISLQNTESVQNENTKGQLDGLEKQLYSFLRSKFGINDNNIIADAKVRDNSYEKTSSGVKFIVDIDSLKATYVIDIENTSKDDTHPNSAVISCPPISQMKYPETYCEGMYNNTGSPELYLPHVVQDQENGIKWEIVQSSNNSSNIIIAIRSCDDEALFNQYRLEATKWFDETPIKQTDYKITTKDFCNPQTLF